MVEAAPENFAQNKQLIEMLRRSRLFRDYEGVFSKATGLPLALRPLDRPATRASQQNKRKPLLQNAGGTTSHASCLFAIAC